ncbi:MAG: hypothetical protein J0I20_32935 [Chloroflexi bacterium]|nr:hypothetical protein [Chloroflexota bacterium]OJV87026.1 MAG: hypothetical protein BGO39_33210 [Chloroflexi bacterium 54-19]
MTLEQTSPEFQVQIKVKAKATESVAAKKRTIILTERDMELLRWTGQGGVAALDQLWRKFWPGAKIQSCYDRLQLLRKAGLLGKSFIDIHMLSAVPAYFLTQKGAELFPREEYERFIVGLPHYNELWQQLLGQEGRLGLERQLEQEGAKLLDWLNERELRSIARRNQPARQAGELVPARKAEIADAQAVIRTKTGEVQRLNIECDGSYYGVMLHKKIMEFADTDEPTLWIVCGKARGKRIKAETEKYPNITVMVVKGVVPYARSFI